MEVPSSDESESDTNLERIIAGANVSVVQGLNAYRLHPSGLIHSELFARMIAYIETRHKSQRCTCSTLTTPSAYLDLEISKYNNTILRNTVRLVFGDIIDLNGNILADAYGTNAKCNN